MALSEAEREHLIAVRDQGELEITIWDVASKYLPAQPESLCPAPFIRSYVTSDLRLVPCGGIGNPEIINLGDAQDVGAVWQGKRYRGFREAHLAGTIPAYCRRCYDL